MEILTTNSAGNDKFGGIHTRKVEQVKHSPQHNFHIVELNHEKRYVTRDNCHIYGVNTNKCTQGKGIFNVLQTSKNHREFDVGVERLVNEYQDAIRTVEPNAILIPGTSLTSYLLYKACRREGVLNKVVHEYAGVLEKEISNYTGDTRYILEQIGKVFVSNEAIDNVTYMFPSQVCKDVVEEIHDVQIENSHIVWNGISSEFLIQREKRNVPKDLTLGYVGRVHNVKNLPFFLNLNNNMKNNSARLKIITDLVAASGKPTGEPLFKKLTEGEVFYYSPRERNELGMFYAEELSASVVSSFFETYCNGAVESLVCGTPTLLSDRAGAKEVFEKYGLSGLVYSINDMRSFESSLDVAREMNFEIPRELSNQISSDLSWKKVIEKYNSIIEGVANRI